MQEKIRAQQERMLETKRDIARRQERKDKQLDAEKQRQAARQWWKQLTSSSTLAWVHSGGARGSSQGETRPWGNQANQSVVVNCNNSTINLNATEEEIEVIDLDQTLTDAHFEAMEQGAEEDTGTDNTRERNKGEKAKDVKSRGL